MYKRVALERGQHVVLQTSTTAPGFVDQLKVYYGKLIVVVSTVLAVINELSPVLNFLPGQDKHYVTVALSGLAGLVALLKKEQGWVNSL